MGKRNKRIKSLGTVKGVLEMHGKFAFLLASDPSKEDIYISGPTLGLAMDGDVVLVELSPGRRRLVEGRIIKVLERKRQSLVGILKKFKSRWVVETEDGQQGIVQKFSASKSPREGDVAVLKITQWPTLKTVSAGTVIEILGDPKVSKVRTTAIVRSRELPDAFRQDVIAESKKFGSGVNPEMKKGRTNLFDLPLFTIDGADAKDFDDAVSLERVGNGYRLGVHIADVSAYVKPGSLLDKEAYARATSIYLPGRVIPMLPPALSDHLCSLMPKVERLALSCFMDLDAHGHVGKYHLCESMIRSWRRFTYEEVELLLQGKTVQGVQNRLMQSVRSMGKLAKILTSLRIKRGALDFDLPEYQVIVDKQGSPTSIKKRSRLMSHRLIEEFMILANEVVARHLISKKMPALHRIHPPPDPKKLEQLSSDVKRLGVTSSNDLSLKDAKEIQTLLKRAKGHPLEEMVAILTVRSLKQAVYSAKPGPHFGLASKAYTHFTSPIRRYPDLMVHRAVKAILKKGGHVEKINQGSLYNAAIHTSERERVAVDAERRAIDMLRAELLSRHVGEEFVGVVTRSMPYGAFVELSQFGASSLARGLNAPVGATVRVKISSVDLSKGEIDVTPAVASKRFHRHIR